MSGVPRRTPPPQGFDRAKLVKKGIHECYYECGRLFRSRSEAEEHAPFCPNQAAAFLELEEMNQRQNFTDPRHGSNSTKSPKKRMKSAEYEKAKMENKMFREYLNQLPRIKRIELLFKEEHSSVVNSSSDSSKSC